MRGNDARIRNIAEWLHERYEDIAKQKGWATQERTRVPFNQLPIENQMTMLAMASEIYEMIPVWYREMKP